MINNDASQDGETLTVLDISYWQHQISLVESQLRLLTQIALRQNRNYLGDELGAMAIDLEHLRQNYTDKDEEDY